MRCGSGELTWLLLSLVQAVELKRQYEAKVGALKETAAKKEVEQAKLWQARLNVVARLRSSVQVQTSPTRPARAVSMAVHIIFIVC